MRRSVLRAVVSWTVAGLWAMSAAGAEPRMAGRGPWGEPGSTLALAQRMDAASMSRLPQTGAVIEETSDRRSFVVWRAPEHFNPSTGMIFVHLPGHQSWASKGAMVWNEEMQARGWALLCVQWWYGRSAEGHGYARPDDIYRWITEALQRHGAVPGRVIFEGYSMGSAACYAVTFLDRRAAKPYVAVTIANSGPMANDYPPNRPFLDGSAGEKPFAATHWIFYCSEHDKEQYEACRRMEQGAEEIKRLGGSIDLFIRDPKGPHGGFMQPGIRRQALDLAETFVLSSRTR